MNLAGCCFADGTSPENSPEWNGSNRGAKPVSPYPERDSNPHDAKHQGILSHFRDRSESVQNDPARVAIGSGIGENKVELGPNGARNFPDKSPEGSKELLLAVFRRVVQDANGCWIWQGCVNSKGYGQIRIGGRKGRTVSVHRYVLELLGYSLGRNDMACHRCDVRRCVNPSHLYKGDAASNAADARRSGSYETRAAKGWDTRRRVAA